MTRQQDPPGIEGELTPRADHGEQSYRGAASSDSGSYFTGEVLSPTGTETSR